MFYETNAAVGFLNPYLNKGQHYIKGIAHPNKKLLHDVHSFTVQDIEKHRRYQSFFLF